MITFQHEDLTISFEVDDERPIGPRQAISIYEVMDKNGEDAWPNMDTAYKKLIAEYCQAYWEWLKGEAEIDRSYHGE